MPRSKANRLNNAAKNGAKLRGPDNQPVTHSPRYLNDNKPWVDAKGKRFDSTEVTPTVD